MIRRCDQGWRIFRSWLQIMQWRIRVEILEVVGVVRGAVIRCPRPTDGELLEAQHVHDADMRQGRAEQVWTLRHTRADEQSTIACSADRQLRSRGVLIRDEPFRCG